MILKGKTGLTSFLEESLLKNTNDLEETVVVKNKAV